MTICLSKVPMFTGQYSIYVVCTLGVSPSLVSRYCEGYSFGSTWRPYVQNFRILGPQLKLSAADSGQLQFWSEPSEILNLRSSNTPETIAFTIPWYLEV